MAKPMSWKELTELAKRNGFALRINRGPIHFSMDLNLSPAVWLHTKNYENLTVAKRALCRAVERIRNAK